MPPSARQNGPSLIGRQKIRLVILFVSKVQGVLANVMRYRMRYIWIDPRSREGGASGDV